MQGSGLVAPGYRLPAWVIVDRFLVGADWPTDTAWVYVEAFSDVITTGVRVVDWIGTMRNWIGTMRKGQITCDAPMLFAAGPPVSFLYGVIGMPCRYPDDLPSDGFTITEAIFTLQCHAAWIRPGRRATRAGSSSTVCFAQTPTEDSAASSFQASKPPMRSETSAAPRARSMLAPTLDRHPPAQ